MAPEQVRAKPTTIHTKVESAAFYESLDRGIRFAVRVLHAHGIDTCQSCQGGKGHSYDRPTLDMPAGYGDATGFIALGHLQCYGLPVMDVSIVWRVENGLPFEKLWRITFSRTFEDRADEQPMFTWGYTAR